MSLRLIAEDSMKPLSHLQANNRVMSFRNKIGSTALTNVQIYLTRYTRDQTEEYVHSAFSYHKEVPFLYQVFKPTDVPSHKEKGGYKVVSAPHPAPSAQYPHFYRSATESSKAR